jgi:hypothetical protein
MRKNGVAQKMDKFFPGKGQAACVQAPTAAGPG